MSTVFAVAKQMTFGRPFCTYKLLCGKLKTLRRRYMFYISDLTDEEIMLIEQLVYMKEGDDTPINSEDAGKSIGMLLQGYTDAVLAEMDSSGTSDADYAAIIRYMKESEKIARLILDGTMTHEDGTVLAYCFAFPDNPYDALVAFSGTTKKEWGDDIEGLTYVDTPRQLDAKRYIDNLSYKNIIVTGHSKGGNKAMYVTVLCDKVTRCVSMDGQGFSLEFLDHYAPEISERAGIIKNYSVKTDFVHVLLFQPPDSQQIYCEGYRTDRPDNAAAHHAGYSFFDIRDGKLVRSGNDGHILIRTKDENGNDITEDPSVIMLHNFTVYLMNVAPSEDKERVVRLIATAADMVMVNGSGKKEMIAYFSEHLDELAILLAYLIKYMDTYGLSSKDIDALLEMLGLRSLDEIFSLSIHPDMFSYNGIKIFGLSDILDLVLKDLTDGKENYAIDIVLETFTTALYFKKIDFDLRSLWSATETKISSIPSVSRDEGLKTPQPYRKAAAASLEHY